MDKKLKPVARKRFRRGAEILKKQPRIKASKDTTKRKGF